MFKETLSQRKRESISRRSLLTLERGATAFFAHDTAVINRDETKLTENSKHLRHASVLPQSFEVTMALGRRPGRWSFPPGHERDPRTHAKREGALLRHWVEGIVSIVAGYFFSTFVLDAISIVFSKAVLGFAGGFAAGRFVRSLFFTQDEVINGLLTIGVGLVTALFIWTIILSSVAISPFVMASLLTYGAGSIVGYATSLFIK